MLKWKYFLINIITNTASFYAIFLAVLNEEINCREVDIAHGVTAELISEQLADRSGF